MSFRGLTESIENPVLRRESEVFGELRDFLLIRNIIDLAIEFSPQEWSELCQEFPEIHPLLTTVCCYFLYEPLYHEDSLHAKELLIKLNSIESRIDQY